MKKNQKNAITDELIAEQKIVHNQGLMRTIYKFENNQAISCININEFYDEAFAQIAYDANREMTEMIKNIRFDGKTLEYEWSDKFFKEKGKGESKEAIEKKLKQTGWKIKKNNCF